VKAKLAKQLVRQAIRRVALTILTTLSLQAMYSEGSGTSFVYCQASQEASVDCTLIQGTSPTSVWDET
jgi:hypothetical protein